MRYAFLNEDNIVVNTLVGDLTTEQQATFLADYAVLFGATQIVTVEDDRAIWSGGRYANAQFSPPVQPDIVEGTSEVIEEPPAMIEETAQEPEI
jgi:hypothetical protein